MQRSFPFPSFSPPPIGKLNTAIADWLGALIVSGGLEPGEAVPREIEFCAEAGVSRSAYREAVRALAAKGLVTSRARTGTRVTSHEDWNLLDPEIVRWFFVHGDPPEYFLQGLYELREVVEPQAAVLAAERCSAADLNDFEAALAGMSRHPIGSLEWRAADSDFHRTLLRATGNAVLTSLASGICAAVNHTTEYKYRNLLRDRDPLIEHKEVVDQIARRDVPGARSAMVRLVSLARHETSMARPRRAL